jgi:CPA1 family monovalent cation:H+ antiporter
VNEAELLIVGVLVAVAGLGAFAARIGVPYPIVLVVGGSLVGFVPGVPEVVLAPDVVLVIFLPPLLYKAAIYANFGDFKASTRGLTLNAVGLVLVTMAAVAAVAHAVADLPWPAAFALGAIVSPTDPVAAATIMRRLGTPRQLLDSVEGEGLFNDATALVAYRVAVAAVMTGGFSLLDAGVQFLAGALGGIAIGVAVGIAAAWVRQRVTDTQVNLTISLLTGYAAYVPAELLHVSGVLATVAAGLYMGIRGPAILRAESRLQGYYVWDIVDFLINAALFVLIGLQLRTVVIGLDPQPKWQVAASALAVSLAVIGVRLVWLFTVPYLVRLLDRRPSQRARRVSAGPRLVSAWSGMRGAVSLAVALALPATTDAGVPFPGRDLIVFLTFAVIFATLVLQGLTLPALIRATGVSAEGEEAREDAEARLIAAEAALRRIDDLRHEQWTRPDSLDRLSSFYQFRRTRFAVRTDGQSADQGAEAQSRTYQRTLREVLAAQRDALITARNRGQLSNEAMNRVLRDLDLEELRLDA